MYMKSIFELLIKFLSKLLKRNNLPITGVNTDHATVQEEGMYMTLNNFIQKYEGKKVDWDKAYGAQCVDLIRQYCAEVWEIPQPEPCTGAEEFITKHDKRVIQQQYMEILPRHVSPVPGDLVVFGSTAKNPYGHIAIFIDWSNGSALEVFEQDGFTQDGAKRAIWTQERIIGFLRKRGYV